MKFSASPTPSTIRYRRACQSLSSCYRFPATLRLPLALGLAVGLGLIGLGGCAMKPPPEPRLADKVVVRKSDRLLQLLSKGQVFREYPINLGDSPRGHKIQQGDERTPEGDYILDWRNPNSQFHKSIHVSYPNQADRDFARAIGVDPGGLIMIHGRPNWLRPGPLVKDYDELDWTDGCIAVQNAAMDEIWEKVRDGTPITILP